MDFLDKVIRPLTIRIFPILSLICILPIILGLAGVALPDTIDQRALATLAALFFGVFSFFYRSHEAEAQSKKQHTLKILFDTRLSAEFRRHLEFRKLHFPEGEHVDPARFTAYLNAQRDTKLSDDEAKSRRQSAEALRSLLNYYEFLSMGISRGDLDEAMLRGSIRGIMCNLVKDCVHIIVDAQETNPRAYENLSDLYNAWRDPQDPALP